MQAQKAEYKGKVRQIDGTTEGRIKAKIRQLVKERREAQLTIRRAEQEIKKQARELYKSEGLCAYPSLEATIRRFSD